MRKKNCLAKTHQSRFLNFRSSFNQAKTIKMTSVEKAHALSELLDLIVEEPLNALRIRGLCREHPGLIASAGLRLKIWSILVLGSDHKEDYNHDIVGPKDPCSEQHVLEADVPRTRAEVAEFRSPTWRESIRLILQKLCVDHDIQYKQGMNEVTNTTYFSCSGA
ncbi:hypothetical protein EON65_40360 [archaeon]|nr:MAG: hypothetical protein EON65_40360 [archaeon]